MNPVRRPGRLLALRAFAPTAAIAVPLDAKLTEMARQGNAEAAYHLGMLYNNGIGVVRDPAKALTWFKHAAAGGDPLGAYKLGC